MVRNYVRKTSKGLSYSKTDLEKAVEDIKIGRFGAKRASAIYKIPLSTLLDHLKGRRGKKSESGGRATTIPYEQEVKLANCIKCLVKHGFGLSRKEILNLVGCYVKENNIKTPFRNETPGKDWFIGFKRRHKLSIKKPQSVEFARKKACDPFIIYEYFTILKETLDNLKLHDKPERIWNLDETSFCTDPSKTKVVGPIGLPATRTTSSPGRENITVLMACNAAGTKVAPLIVFKGKNVWDEWTAPLNTGYTGTTYAATSKGWMETEVFENYFIRSFLKEVGPERPVVVIYDGHTTHISINVIQRAIDEQITIIKLPPHTSHLLQPLDLSVFKPFKSMWDERLVKWQRQHNASKVPKKIFSLLLGNVWKDIKPEVLQHGFKKGGIHPFNNQVIDKSKFDPQALKRWENHQLNSSPPTMVEKNDLIEHNPESTLIPSVAPQPGTSGASSTLLNKGQETIDEYDESSNSQNSQNASFEELFLRTVRSSTPITKNKKKKVASGAEVVTKEDILIKLRLKKEEEKKKGEKKLQKTKQKSKTTPNTTTQKNKRKHPKPGQLSSEDSDSDIDNPDSYNSDSDSDEGDLKDQIMEEEDFDNETETMLDSEKKRKVNDWVLVQFANKSSIKHFVGTILRFQSGYPVVQFLRKVPNKRISIFTYPDNEDISEVQEEDIVKNLPEPAIGRRGELVFKLQFSSYNVQ